MTLDTIDRSTARSIKRAFYRRAVAPHHQRARLGQLEEVGRREYVGRVQAQQVHRHLFGFGPFELNGVESEHEQHFPPQLLQLAVDHALVIEDARAAHGLQGRDLHLALLLPHGDSLFALSFPARLFLLSSHFALIVRPAVDVVRAARAERNIFKEQRMRGTKGERLRGQGGPLQDRHVDQLSRPAHVRCTAIRGAAVIQSMLCDVDAHVVPSKAGARPAFLLGRHDGCSGLRW